jgi:LAO/AO transport system kinase
VTISSGHSPSLAERLVDGELRALARAITLVENDDPAGWELARDVFRHTGQAWVVGLTGSPGAGKSTLISALTRARRAQGRQVAVLSIDPSSPFTRGALLGDRVRLTEHYLDPGVFIRSMATRGALGGLSEAALQAMLLMDASGRHDIFLETVGVGQAEVDVMDNADTVVLVLIPGAGDAVQALKAGIMEIPDVIVVNKADHPDADKLVNEIRGVLSLVPAPEGAWEIPIVRTQAHQRTGVDNVIDAIDEHRRHLDASGTLAARRRRNMRSEIVALCMSWLRARVVAEMQRDADLEVLLDEVVARRLDPGSAARRVLGRVAPPPRADGGGS